MHKKLIHNFIMTTFRSFNNSEINLFSGHCAAEQKYREENAT